MNSPPKIPHIKEADWFLLMENEIVKWFDHIQQPRAELGGSSICPFAKAAISAKQYNISNSSVDHIHLDVETCDIVKYKVCIFILPEYKQYSETCLSALTTELNNQFRLYDKVVLDNDPRKPFIINGVTTSFEHSYLWIVQSLSDLSQKYEMLKKSKYYTYWTQDQIDEVVTWRNQSMQ